LLRGAQEGHLPSLLVTLLPQMVAGVLLGILLLVLVGPQQLQHLLSVSEKLNSMAAAGAQPTPEQVQSMIADLPAGRILLWLLLGIGLAVVAGLTVFVSVPRVVFDGRPGLAAMGDSLRACLHSLPALAVLAVVTVAVYLAVMLLALVVQAVAGPLFGALVGQALLMAVVRPLLAGAVLVAWGQLFGRAAAP